MFKRKAEKQDLKGWTFQITNNPLGSRNFDVIIRDPEGHKIGSYFNGAIFDLHVRAKNGEQALEKAKQIAYNVIAKQKKYQAAKDNSKTHKF